MRVQPRQLAAFLKAPDPAIRCFLIYGADTTLVADRAAQIFKALELDPKDPFGTDTLSADQVASDPASLADAAAAQSLMGGRRLVRVMGAGDKLTASLKPLLSDYPGDSVIVIEAGELKRTGSLVKAAEGSDLAASIACYAEEARDREGLFNDLVRDAGLRIDRDALDWLVENLDGNRGIIRSEFDKLALAAAGSGTVTLDLVTETVSGESDTVFDTLVQLACSGETAALGTQLERARDQGLNEVALTRILIAHFCRLLEAQAMVSMGDDPDTAVGKLRPKLFFKVVAGFKAQLRLWPLAAIKTQLARLEALEGDLKSSGSPGWILCERQLYQLAVSAARARRR